MAVFGFNPHMPARAFDAPVTASPAGRVHVADRLLVPTNPFSADACRERSPASAYIMDFSEVAGGTVSNIDVDDIGCRLVGGHARKPHDPWCWRGLRPIIVAQGCACRCAIQHEGNQRDHREKSDRGTAPRRAGIQARANMKSKRHLELPVAHFIESICRCS